MKKVFLYAYDCQNLGDDLFVHAIAKRYPGVKFFIWSDAMNVETFRQIPNLKVINDDSKYVRCLKRIRHGCGVPIVQNRKTLPWRQEQVAFS